MTAGGCITTGGRMWGRVGSLAGSHYRWSVDHCSSRGGWFFFSHCLAPPPEPAPMFVPAPKLAAGGTCQLAGRRIMLEGTSCTLLVRIAGLEIMNDDSAKLHVVFNKIGVSNLRLFFRFSVPALLLSLFHLFSSLSICALGSVLSRLISSRLVMSYHVSSCLVSACLIMPCFVWS